MRTMELKVSKPSEDVKMSWVDTAKAMVAMSEEWLEWDAIRNDGVLSHDEA